MADDAHTGVNDCSSSIIMPVVVMNTTANTAVIKLLYSIDVEEGNRREIAKTTDET